PDEDLPSQPRSLLLLLRETLPEILREDRVLNACNHDFAFLGRHHYGRAGADAPALPQSIRRSEGESDRHLPSRASRNWNDGSSVSSMPVTSEPDTAICDPCR